MKLTTENTENKENTERATPETDAFAVKFKSVCGSKAWVPTDICRRFERERDEAQEALAATKHYLTKERDDALSQIVQAECRAERFCQERDEAREALREIAEASGFDNIGDWARNKARKALKGAK